VPIASRAGAGRRVAMSLRLPALRPGERLRLFGEVQVSTTCSRDRRSSCIGRPYEYNPELSARLLIADRPTAVGGHRTRRVGAARRVVCHQRTPNRNHHCVLAFAPRAMRVGQALAHHCRNRCYANLALAAHNWKARPRQVVVLGADRPSGRVAQGQSRLNAVVVPRRASHGTVRRRDNAPSRRRLPTRPRGGRRARVLYSVKLPKVHRGDRIIAMAAARLGIGRLPYNAYLHSQLVLAPGRRATGPGRATAHSAILGGALTPANGFNCTHGRSGYRTPCRLRKAGMTVIRRVPRAHGHRVPLFVNFVAGAKALLKRPKAHDAARVLGGGHLRVLRLRAR
jgi:hypothetical protein